MSILNPNFVLIANDRGENTNPLRTITIPYFYELGKSSVYLRTLLG